MRLCAGLAVSFVLATLASAQTVRVVGGGGPFTEIQDAVDAANPGDVVLVHPGTYEPFTVDGKGLVVHAATSTPPVIKGTLTVQNLPAAETLTLRGLDINTALTLFIAPPVLDIVDCAGSVWIEEVRTNAGPGHVSQFAGDTGTRVTGCASVVFVRCELVADLEPFGSGPVAGLLTIDSDVAIYESVLTGGRVTQSPFTSAGDGQTGLDVDGGSVFASGCQIQGGNGLQGLDDFTCNSCSGGDGGDAVRMQGANPQVSLRDTVLTPGSGAPADDPNSGFCQSTTLCADGVDGVARNVMAGVLQEFQRRTPITTVNSPVRDGETIVETFTGQPGEFVVLVFSPFQAGAVFLPGVLGPGFIGNPAFFQEIGILDGTGQASALIPNNLLDPGFQGVPLFLQGVFISPGLLVRISSPSVLLLLNPPF